MAKRSDGSSRLQKIRDKLKQTNLKSGSSFWKPEQGDNLIRILPGVGDMDEVFFVQVGTHFLETSPNNWKSWLCPKETFGDPCPICEYVAELRATGDESDKNMANDIRAQRTWPMNIIVRGKEEEEKGPQIFHAKVTMMRQINAMVMDDEYGEMIFDVDKGLDIKITRSGKQRQTNYNLTARRRATPLSEDPDQIDAWLDAALDLTPIQLTDDPSEDSELFNDENGEPLYVFGVMPYDRIAREFEGDEEEDEDEDEDWDEEEDVDDEEEDEDEDDGVSAAREAINRRRSSKSSTKKTAPRAPRRRRR